MKYALTLAGLLGACLALGSCSSEYGEMIQLSAELKKAYSCEETKISITNKELVSVELLNCPCIDSPLEVKQKISNAIGRRLQQHPGLLSRLKKGTTVFIRRENYALGNGFVRESFPMQAGRKP